MKKKLFSLLTLLLCVASGAWADEYTITLDASGMKTSPVCAGLAAITIGGDASISSNAVQVGDGKTGTITITRTVDNVYIKEILFTDTNHSKNGGFTFTGTAEQGAMGEYNSDNGTYTWTAESDVKLTTVSFQLLGSKGTAKMKVTQIVISDPDNTYEEIKTFTGPSDGSFGFTSSKGTSTISVTNPSSNGASVNSGRLQIGNSKSVIISSTENIESITFVYYQDNYKPAADKLGSSPAGTYTPATFTWIPTESIQSVTFTNGVGSSMQWVSFYIKTTEKVDISAPVLKSTTPANSATEVATSGNIVLTFDENVALVSDYQFTLKQGETTVKTWDGGGVNPAASVSGKTITLAYSGLASATTYSLNINNANKITDTAATPNAMSSISLPSFTTVDARPSAPISWSAASYTAVMGESNTFPSLTNTVPVTVSYSSSDPTVASFADASVYSITLNKKGSATIYATYTDEGSTYKTTVVSYTLNVTNLSAVDNQFWKVSDTKWGDADYNLEVIGSFIEIRDPLEAGAAVYDEVTFTKEAKAEAGKTPAVHFRIKGNTKVTVYGRVNSANNTATASIFVGNTDGDAVATASWSDKTKGGKVVYLNTENVEKDIYMCGLSKQWDLFGVKVQPIVAITPSYDKITYVTTENLDFANVSPSGLTAYAATNAGASSVTMSPVETVPSATPLLLAGTASTTYYVPVVESATAPETNYLVKGDGSTDMSEVAGYNYILYSDGLFYRCTSGTIATTKAYLHLESAPSSHALDIIFDEDNGDVTGIAEVSSKKEFNGEYFNLSGQKVQNPTKGLYIVNGRKVVIK